VNRIGPRVGRDSVRGQATIVDRLECIRIFQKTAFHRSFSEAARQLRIPPAAVSRAVSELEQLVGVQLLRRTTRSVRLTNLGALYLERAARVLEELDYAAEAVRSDNARPEGMLVVTSPVMFGRSHVMPIVTSLLREHPNLSIRLTLVDRVTLLVDEGIDIAIRIGRLPESCLQSRTLASVSQILVASPDYLARCGAPSSVDQLASHKLIAFDTASFHDEWGRVAPSIQVEPRLVTNSVDATIEAAAQGLGIARVFSSHVTQQLRDGSLVRITVDSRNSDVPVNLIFQENRRQSRNVAAFVAAACEAFPNTPSL
jgi:DNA-binding transcriptional LysR family regulator